MRKILALLALVFIVNATTASPVVPAYVPVTTTEVPAGLSPALQAQLKGGIDYFLALTPSSYHKMTGKKLSVTEVVKLKTAQKMLKKQMRRAGEDVPKGLYIVLALLGWAWLIMGIKDDWKGNNWWVNLILSLLCLLPGIIHAFIKMKDYYKN